MNQTVREALEAKRADLKRQKEYAESEIEWGERFLAIQRRDLNAAIDGIIAIEEELGK